MKKALIVIGVITLAIIALGCSGSSNNGSSTSDNYQQGNSTQAVQEVSQPALTILNSKLVKEEYSGYSITGTAKANKDLTYAEVSAKCYGPDGAVIGSYLTNMQNLKSGETWNFTVIVPTDESTRVTNYTIANGNSL
jgi:hypothetical protein